ncbi:retrotransposon protein [Cucumis melo var. makuwa]|uniref:Retrotransposon protein n=1 Tax=Cucumis melo var. makuwa TaxID=1194695 RepID=A0A5A7UNF3_CUCMM|nr:retrotransposon protein [Cucumis melo var. makuwa]TYK21032.1 retrotransposon protein [Cucumis melo var. makuwa]
MTNCEDIDDVDEGDSAYATTTTPKDIQYIKTTNEWSQWRDELAKAMFTEWQLLWKSCFVPLSMYGLERRRTFECLVELVSTEGSKSNNGTFRPGYLSQLVCMMAEKLLGCCVHAITVIDCRIKTLKQTFQAIAEMRRTTDRFTETFIDVRFNEPASMRGLTCRMGTRSFHPCTARGLTCPKRVFTHHNLLAGCDHHNNCYDIVVLFCKIGLRCRSANIEKSIVKSDVGSHDVGLHGIVKGQTSADVGSITLQDV